MITAEGASFGLVPIDTGTAVLEGAGLSAACATSKLASNALMEFLTPTPPRSIAAINSARSKGRAPDPAIAPKSAEEITLPALSATFAKSAGIKTLAAFFAASRRTVESTRPSPSAIFSVME